MKQVISTLIFSALSLLFSFQNAGSNAYKNVENKAVLNLYREFYHISTSDSVFNYLVRQRKRIKTLSDDEVFVVSLDIDTIKNAMRFEEYYQEGNSSLEINEYKVVKIKSSTKFIYSKFVGTNAFTSQSEFQVYNYDAKKNKFTVDPVTEKIFDIKIQDYFKSNTPDSVISEFLTHSSNFYHLVYNAQGIAEKILVDELRFNNMKENKWLRGNTIRFSLKDNFIVRSRPFFDE